MDDSGIDHQIKKDKGWAKRGTKIVGEKSGKKRGRTNIIGGYKNGKLIAPFRINNSIDSDILLAWLAKVLLPIWHPDDILIMDNASWHKTKKVKAFLKKHGIQFMYQPPYSPDLNPIEHYWAKMKKMMKKLENTMDNFYERLDYVLSKC
jgi:transposase